MHNAIEGSINGYDVLGKLGSGGMGDVYLGVKKGPLGTKQLVVMKIANAANMKEKWDANLMDEARVTMHLHHPNIVRVVDWTKYMEKSCIVTEYIEGFNLNQISAYLALKKRHMPLYVIAQIMLQAGEALAYIHNAETIDKKPLNIIHRDIDLKNIMVGDDGFVKIIDFGIAKNAIQEELTKPGVYKGKLTYIAPDVFENEKVDKRADIYSLGLVMYELLTGEKPRQFPEKSTIRQAIEVIKNLEIPAPSTLNHKIPTSFDQIVAKATSQDRDNRYSDVSEMLDDLRHLSSKLRTGADHAFIRNWMTAELSQLRELRVKKLKDVKGSFAIETQKKSLQKSSTNTIVYPLNLNDAAIKRMDGVNRTLKSYSPRDNRGRIINPIFGVSLFANAVFAMIIGVKFFTPSPVQAEKAAPIIVEKSVDDKISKEIINTYASFITNTSIPDNKLSLTVGAKDMYQYCPLQKQKSKNKKQTLKKIRHIKRKKTRHIKRKKARHKIAAQKAVSKSAKKIKLQKKNNNF